MEFRRWVVRDAHFSFTTFREEGVSVVGDYTLFRSIVVIRSKRDVTLELFLLPRTKCRRKLAPA